MTISARATAVNILVEVLQHRRSLTASLTKALPQLTDQRERSLASELSYGVLRWFPRLETLLGELLHRPVRHRDTDIRVLLLLGLYQLTRMRTPPHAAVAVSIANSRGKPWASGFVNGVLRSYLRDHDRLMNELDRSEEAALAHPAWLIDRVRDAWPDAWDSILSANNQRPPMILRVNQKRIDREAYSGMLATAGHEARPTPHTNHGLTLTHPVEARFLPGFNQGLVSIQDGGAQLAAGLLNLQVGSRVLDACAAPGGKTTHILEAHVELADMVAVDIDEKRLSALRDALQRLGQSTAQVIRGDAGEPRSWWDGQPFDRILVDAPCSAIGVIRRHPDIKVLRQPSDIQSLSRAQARLLEALWPLLTGRGLLLYATCSILPQENEERIIEFMKNHPDAMEEPIEVNWGRKLSAGRQVLPNENGMDGFYYAMLRKR